MDTLTLSLPPTLERELVRLQQELIEFTRTYNRNKGIDREVTESDWPLEKVALYMLKGYLNMAPDVHNNFPLPDPYALAEQLLDAQSKAETVALRKQYTAQFLEDLMGRLLRQFSSDANMLGQGGSA